MYSRVVRSEFESWNDAGEGRLQDLCFSLWISFISFSLVHSVLIPLAASKKLSRRISKRNDVFVSFRQSKHLMSHLELRSLRAAVQTLKYMRRHPIHQSS